MKFLLVVLFGLILTCQGAPVDEDYEDDDGLIDATYMEEPEAENEQSEVFGDNLETQDQDEDEIEEDPSADPSTKGPSGPGPLPTLPIPSAPTKKHLKKVAAAIRCPPEFRFCKSHTACDIVQGRSQCKVNRFCVCSHCPKATARVCGFEESCNGAFCKNELKCKCTKK